VAYLIWRGQREGDAAAFAASARGAVDGAVGAEGQRHGWVCAVSVTGERVQQACIAVHGKPVR
jgi:hypothetical protein